MAQDYNLVGPRVVQHPHKILAVLVRYHDSLFRSSCCSETRWSHQFGDNLSGKTLLRILVTGHRLVYLQREQIKIRK